MGVLSVTMFSRAALRFSRANATARFPVAFGALGGAVLYSASTNAECDGKTLFGKLDDLSNRLAAIEKLVGSPEPEYVSSFPSGQGASHGPWTDNTTAQTNEIHAPRYFSSYADFGDALAKCKGELILSDYLTEAMYNKYKDTRTSLGVTLDKCIKGGVDRAQLGKDWNSGKVGWMFGDAECASLFRDLVHPIMLGRHNNPNLPHPP